MLGFDMNKTESLLDMFDKNKDYRLSVREFADFYAKVEELWVNHGTQKNWIKEELILIIL